jgi:tetratricopeptide (TPR) repeat protein
MNTNRPEQAEKAFREAIVSHRKLANAFPGRPEHRVHLANGQISMAYLLSNTGRPREAEAAYREALALFNHLANEFPNVPRYRRGVGIGQNDLGVVLAAENRLREAEAAYREALTTRKQLVTDFPNEPDYQDDLAATMVSLAELLYQRREFAAARGLLEEAQPHHQVALQANRANPISRHYYRTNRVLLVRTLAGLGEEAASLATAEQLARLGWDPPVDAYFAAGALPKVAP